MEDPPAPAEAAGRRPGDARSGAPAAGSRAGFEARVVELLPELYGTALRLTKNEADAEDLVAEAVARAWKHRDSLREPDRFRGWLFRILSNRFVSRRRERKARRVVMSLDEDAEEAGEHFSLFERLHQPFLLWWGNPESRFLDRLLREDLERAIDGLPEPFRVAVILADVQGFSYREIAEITDVPIGTVRSRLARARSRLQEALWKHAEDRGMETGRPSANDDRPEGRAKGNATP